MVQFEVSYKTTPSFRMHLMRQNLAMMSMQPEVMEWPLEWKTLTHSLVLNCPIVLCIRAIVNQSASPEYHGSGSCLWGKAIGIPFEITWN